MKIVVASTNKGKIKEIRELFQNHEILSLADLNFNEEIVENGNDFTENAYIKAKTIYDKYHLPVIADDSGICCYGLDLAPGIYSARYAGTCNDEDNNNLLLKNLREVEDRRCYYECAIVCILDENKAYKTTAKIEGEIIFERRGNNGFGYDPYFYLKEFDKTMAELSLEQKNKISHRAKALLELKKILNI